MAKIYMFRHQAGGVISDFVFSESPSDEQKAAVARQCFQSFGATHPKTDEPYWLVVVERDVLAAGEVPNVPERVLGSVESVASVPAFAGSGSMNVTPKAGS